MNEIFVIIDNKYNFVNLIFDNYINEFIFFDEKYHFTFVSKNKLRVYKNNLDVILYTIDSFIFIQKEEDLKKFQLIEMIHNDWFDQSLLIYDTQEIIRVKDRDQKGSFLIFKNKIKVNWIKWGSEFFYKNDTNIYIQENYNQHQLTFFETKITKITKKNKIIIFMHCCTIENGLFIFRKQIEKIMASNLYIECEKIIINVLGEIKENCMENYENKEKIEFLYSKSPVDFYELETINILKKYIDNLQENYNILYLHNKGVRKAGNEDVISSWRNMMEYYLIDQYQLCNELLNNNIVNTIGNNIINTFSSEKDNIVCVNKNHCYHYSGNFWWSQSEYIKKLEYINIEKKKEVREKQRYQAENWILSKKIDKKTGILYQNNNNLHPYHRFVFENYKNKKIFLKLI